MSYSSIKFHGICKYLILCTVFGCFISVILVHNEYHKCSIVRQLLGAHRFILDATSSRALEENPEKTTFNVKDRKIEFLKNYKNPCWYEWASEESIVDQNVDSQRNNDSSFTLRCLPYFMIIGQPKCATSDVFHRLSLHPQVEAIAAKGPHWWTRLRYKGASFDDYVGVFDKAAEVIRMSPPNELIQHDIVTGEVSTSTLWDTFNLTTPSYDGKKKLFKQEIAAEIKSLVPTVKLIVVLRNPMERLYSDYLYFNKKGHKSQETFHRHVTASVMAFNKCAMVFSYSNCLHNDTVVRMLKVRLHLGIYAVYLEEWYRVFPKEQILVINFDDYVSNLKECLKKLFNFLQLRELNDEESSGIILQRPSNVNTETRKHGKILPQTKLLLENFYSKFNVKLARLLQNDSFLWKRPKKRP